MPQRRPHAPALALCAAAFTAFAAAPSRDANAQRRPGRPAVSPAADPAALEAQRAYDAGRAATTAGNPDEALAQFQRAFELRPTPAVLIAIASAQETLQRVADAIATLERYLREAPADAPDRASAQERLTALRQRPAVLHAVTTPAGAHILVDGSDTGQVTPADVTLSAGHHAVRFELAGHLASASELDAQPGERRELTATLETEPPPPPPPVAVAPEPTPAPAEPVEPEAPRGPGPAVWTAGALSVAGVVSGTVFGLLTLGDLATYNTEGMATRALKDRGETFALVADISFVTAILAGGVAVVIFASERAATPPQPASARAPSRDERRARLFQRAPSAPRVSAGPLGLTVQF